MSEVEVNRLTGFLKHRSNYAFADTSACRSANTTQRNGQPPGSPANRGHRVSVNDWLVIDLALSTGLRVSEIANLRCGDIWADDGQASLIVRNGKNGKQRIVKFGAGFKVHLREYLEWKERNGQDCGPEAPLILSSNTMNKMTTRALQKAFERNAKRVGIEGYSIHSLRHTYATFLLRASGNLRLVQKQLGHSSITTTQVYADVLNPELDQALARLYK